MPDDDLHIIGKRWQPLSVGVFRKDLRSIQIHRYFLFLRYLCTAHVVLSWPDWWSMTQWSFTFEFPVENCLLGSVSGEMTPRGARNAKRSLHAATNAPLENTICWLSKSVCPRLKRDNNPPRVSLSSLSSRLQNGHICCSVDPMCL